MTVLQSSPWALAAFELTGGLLLIGKRRKVEIALALSTLFNLFLVILGLSSQATDTWTDFLNNCLPNLIFVVLQLPLLFTDFERSIPDLITGWFSKKRMAIP